MLVCRSVIYVDGGVNGVGGGLYSEPNTITKPVQYQYDHDPSKLYLDSCVIRWMGLGIDERLIEFLKDWF